MTKKRVAIIGGGAAALMAAYQLGQDVEVTIYEKGKALGRKFLVAGHGGFNLTNGVDGAELVAQYIPVSFLSEAIQNFGSHDTRQWLANIGIPTFVGTSNRIFPEEGIKPIHVLQKIQQQLVQQGCSFCFEHEFCGFDDYDRPLVNHQGEERAIIADKYIFALGGASWSVTGSKGDWVPYFEQIGVETMPFQSSNCGVNTNWGNGFINKYAGQPLKNIALTINDKRQVGEALITDYGVEGNAVYPIIPWVREAINTNGEAVVFLDCKPQNTIAQLVARVEGKKVLPKNYKYVFKLSKAQLELAKQTLTKEEYLNPVIFAKSLKAIPLTVKGLRPIEEAISTVGGIALTAVNTDLSLKNHNHIYIIGEMLDWDAPTGGFLLQACFSMGAFVAQRIRSH